MPAIDLKNVEIAKPPNVAGINVTPDGMNVAAAQAVVPQVVQGITASPMPPVTYAGLQLAKIVLSILGISLAVLMAYLWTSEWHYGIRQAGIYEKVLSQATSASDPLGQLPIDKYTKAFRNAALDPNLTLAAEEQAMARSLFENLRRIGAVSDQQFASLNSCTPFPSDSSARATALTACAGILDDAEKKIVAASPALERVRLLTDLSKQINEHRQSFHASWIQEAQLILLNLLMPLLTGLFGYIFGTQQAPSNRSGAS